MKESLKLHAYHLHSQDVISNFPYCLPYISFYNSSENLALDQLISLIIPQYVLSLTLINCLLDLTNREALTVLCLTNRFQDAVRLFSKRSTTFWRPL